MAIPVTLITGASGGIGEALAYEAARAGRKLALVARSKDRLQSVAEKIASDGHARSETFALDLMAADAPDRLAEALKARGLTVAELVNNAGYGVVGRLANSDVKEQAGMVDLNVRALTDLTLRFLPQIVATRGGVLNVGSTSSFMPGPGMAIYYASKAYVLSFSEALYHELKGQVRVTALCPGPTTTGFQERALPGSRRLVSLFPHMSAERVAVAGWRGFERGKRVVVPGFFNKLVAWSAPASPRAIVLPLVDLLTARRQGH